MIELLKEIRKKDKNAVTVLYNRYGKKLYGYAVLKWKMNEDESWELVYKTLYKVIEVSDRYKFESETKFAGFIFQSFVNNLRNLYKEKKNKPAEVLAEYAITNAAEQQYETAEPEATTVPMKILQEELKHFEEWQQILLLMRAQDFSYEEISKYVNKPSQQLKVYYLRLKRNLTERMNQRINKNTNAEI
jgi:DNA-directed RNA polymerase specialized sigma24 family protein